MKQYSIATLALNMCAPISGMSNCNNQTKFTHFQIEASKFHKKIAHDEYNEEELTIQQFDDHI